MVTLALDYASMIRRQVRLFTFVVAAGALAACARAPKKTTSNGVPLAGPLIPATTTMVTAWDVPDNPLTDPALDDSRLSKDIRWGFKLFTNTPAGGEGRFAPGRMACANCHLNAGQRERSLPLVAVAAVFPEYNRRSGRLYSLNDRIVDCFWRSENATGVLGEDDAPSAAERILPSPTSKEVLAIAAYITWLARGATVGKNPGVARTERDCGRRADSRREARSPARRSDLQRALHVVPRPRRSGRDGRRQETWSAVGTRFVE